MIYPNMQSWWQSQEINTYIYSYNVLINYKIIILGMDCIDWYGFLHF